MGEIRINDIRLLEFCERRIAGNELPDFPAEFPSDRCVCFGDYRSDGEPLWVVVLYDFKERHDCLIDVCLNMGGVFTPSLFKMIGRVVFDYAFNQSNLLRCTIHIRKSNKSSLRLSKAWGFKEEGFKRLGYKNPPEDMHILGMLKTECQWI